VRRFLAQAIKKDIERGLEIAGSQNELARILGYSGKNCGCQINYFLCGRLKNITEERYNLLLQLLNK